MNKTNEHVSTLELSYKMEQIRRNIPDISNIDLGKLDDDVSEYLSYVKDKLMIISSLSSTKKVKYDKDAWECIIEHLLSKTPKSNEGEFINSLLSFVVRWAKDNDVQGSGVDGKGFVARIKSAYATFNTFVKDEV